MYVLYFMSKDILTIEKNNNSVGSNIEALAVL